MMGLSAGIWTDGIDRTPVTGPWQALRRMLLALDTLDTDHEFYYLHPDSDNDEPFYHGDNEIICDRSLRGKVTLERADLDVVMDNGVPDSLKSLLFHTYLGTNTVVWIHGSGPWIGEYSYGDTGPPDTSTVRQLRRKALVPLALDRVDVPVTNSEFNRRVMVESMGVSLERAEYIHYGGGDAAFRPMPDRDFEDLRSEYGIGKGQVIVYIANRNWKKRPKTVVRSFHRLRERGLPCELVIVGAGWDDTETMALVDRLGVSEYTNFTGYVDDDERIAELYNLADVSLFPTVHETFGMPLLESMASGCPLVTSDCTVVPEIVADAAVQVDDPTDDEVIADAVETVLSDPDRRKALQRAGIERANAFSWEACASKFVSIFDQLGG